MNFNNLKIFVIRNNWSGGTIDFFIEAFKELNINVKIYNLPSWKFFSKRMIPTRLLSVETIKKRLMQFYYREVNREIEREVFNYKPDIFFVQNESDLLPETVEKIQSKNIITVNNNGDYIFDSARYLFFPITLKYYDYVFYGEKIWLENYKRIAPNTKFIKMIGAYSEKYFYPLSLGNLIERKDLFADISFAGSAYGFKAEGHYRVEILNNVSDLGLKIWGGDRWDRYFRFYPNLEKCYQGRHLNFQELNILYQNSKINLNITNPQCITTFQQRTFEIAAAKSFQIADYKEEIYEYFDENEIETFKTIDELRDKIKFYLNNDNLRLKMAEKAYNRVISNKHTYKDRAISYLQLILNN